MKQAALVATIGVLSLAFLLSKLASGFSIDSELKSLLPGSNQLAVSASERLAGDTSGATVIMVSSPAGTDAQAARDLVRTAVNETAGLSLSLGGQQEPYTDLVATLQRFRGGLLAETDRERVLAASPLAWQPVLEGEFYGFGDVPRILAYGDDPLNLLGRFIAEALPDSRLEPYADHVRMTATDQTISVFVLLPVAGQNGFAQMQTQRDALQQLADRLAAAGHDVQMSGALFHVVRAAAQARNEITLIGSASLVIVVLLYLWLFRSLAALVFAVCSIAFGCLVAAATVIALFGEVHILALVFGTTLVGISIDYSLHYFCTAVAAASGDTESRLRLSSLAAALTTSAAYLFLVQVDLLIVQQMAVIAATGLLMSWLFVSRLLPHFFPGGVPLYADVATRLLGYVQQLSRHRWRGTWILLPGFLLLGSLVILQDLRVSQDLQDLFRADDDLVAQDQQVQAQMEAFTPGRFLLLQASDMAELTRGFAQLRVFLQQQKTLGRLDRYLLLDDLLPTPGRQLRNQADLQQLALHAEQLAGMTGLDRALVEASLTQPVMTAAEYVPGAQRLFPNLWLGEQQGRLTVTVPIRETFPGALGAANLPPGVILVDLKDTWASLLAEITRKALVTLCAAVVLVASGLLIWLRHRGALAIVALPLVSATVTMALLVATGTSVTLFHLLGLYLVVGLGLDYGVFLFRDEAGDVRCLIAVVMSAATTIAAFGLLGLSSSPMVAAFGQTVLVGSLFNIVLCPGIQVLRGQAVR